MFGGDIMRYKPKNQKTQIIIICIAVVIIVIAQYMGFSTTRTATRILFSTNEGWYTWSANYFLLHGDLTKTIHAEQNPSILHIDIETESGQISISVKDMDGNLIFKKDNIPTSSFSISIPGNVKVRIDAQGHKGSFLISTLSS